MDFEKKNTPLDSDIEKIKKAEEKMQVKNAVEESEIESIVEAAKKEIPVDENKEEVEADAEREKIIEGLELNPEAKERKEAKKRLKKYITEIQEKTEKYDTVDMINPLGRITEKGRLTYKDEIKIFKEEIKKDPNYNPVFTYPQIEEIKIDDLESKIKDLGIMKERIGAEENNEHIKKLFLNV